MKNNKMNRISLYMPIQDRQHYRPRFISNFSALPHSFHRKNIRHSHSLKSCQLTDSARTNRKYETCKKLQKRPLIQMSVHKIKKNSQSASITHKTEKKRSSIKIRREQLNISQPSLLITKLQKSVRTQRVKTQPRNLTEMELYRNSQMKNQSNKYQSTDESGIRNFSKGLNYNEKQARTMRNLHIPQTKQKYYSRKANIKLSNIKIDQLLNIYLNRMQDNQTHK